MRHINDKPELWSEMWRKQVDLNCIPYYMFIARDTGAKRYYDSKATWFNQLKPAFGEKKFFFEEQRSKLLVTKPFLFE
ncbi:MAG: hypothetical protein LBN37_03730 [Bacteroidales bacterium]|nr:hypothetical protein [Bacteroidales bacterium]